MRAHACECERESFAKFEVQVLFYLLFAQNKTRENCGAGVWRPERKRLFETIFRKSENFRIKFIRVETLWKLAIIFTAVGPFGRNYGD